MEGHGERAEVTREALGEERRRRRRSSRVPIRIHIRIFFSGILRGSIHEPNADDDASVPNERGWKRCTTADVVYVVHALGDTRRSEHQRRQLDRYRRDHVVTFSFLARLCVLTRLALVRERHREPCAAFLGHRAHDVFVHGALVYRPGPVVARDDAGGFARHDQRVFFLRGDEFGAVGQGVRDRHGRARWIFTRGFFSFIRECLGGCLCVCLGWFIGSGGGFVLRVVEGTGGMSY